MLKQRERHPYWSDEDDRLLREIYPSQGADPLIERLGRSRAGIRIRAKRLGVKCHKSPPWTTEEDDILRQRYPTEGASVGLQKTLSRTANAIWVRTQKLGLLMHDRYHANREHSRNKGRYGDKWSYYKGLGSISGSLISRLIRGARKRGKTHSLLLAPDGKQYLLDIVTDTCPLSGRPLRYAEHNKDRAANASLDRIDPLQGYEKGNVRWIDQRVNYMKLDMTDAEFLELVWDIARTNPPPEWRKNA